MIKWEGFFRDQQYNSKYKVEIINSDGDENVEVSELTTLFGVELDKGEYSCFVKLDPNDPFCSHSTDISEIGYYNYVVNVVVEKETDTVYFNAVNDNITIIGEQGELPIQHTYQCTVLKLEGNTNYLIDDEHYFSNHEYLCYETQSEEHEIIKCRNYSFRELMLEGDSPVIIRYEGDDEDVFKPVRYSECTIKLITNWYDEDLFSKRTTDNKVSIYVNRADEDEEEDYSLEWTGYLTPNVYSQGFAYDIEGLELNAVDSLAVLKNKRFEGKKKARSASKILFDMLHSNISTIFMSDTIKVGDVVEPHSEIDGYTILDYITTDGTAFIDTHYSACNLTFIETTASINYENATDYMTLFGAASYNHPQAQGLDRKCQMIVRAYNFNHWNDKYYSYFAANFSYSNGIMENINIATPTLIQVGNINGKINAQDSAFLQVGDTNNIKWYANVCSRSDRSLYLFGQHAAHQPNTSDNSQPLNNCAGMSLGRFKIYEWEEVDEEMKKVLKMDLVPVKRNSDSMLGFYNVMTNELLTTTQGAFIQGSPASSSDTSKLVDYTILDYIATDGTAYIDTNYYPSNTTRVSSDFSVNYENIGELPCSIYGAESDGKSTIILSVGDYDNIHNVGYLTCTYCAGQSSAAYAESFATKRNVDMGYKYSSNLERYASVKYDDVENEFICYPLDRSDKTMYVFGYNTFWNSDHHPRGIVAGTAIGRFKIYENDNLVMDLIPVKKNSNSELGFYDIIGDNFFTNAASSGAFIQGSPAEGDNSIKELSKVEFSQSLDLNKLILSDYQFYDEDNKEWDFSNKILEEMCKYLCMTAVVQGNYLYIIDLADKINNFQVYNRTSNDYQKRPYGVTIRYTKDWNADDYVDDGTQISMNPVYNQLKLENKLDDFNNLTDNLFLRKNLTNLYGERYKVDEGSQFDNDNRNVVIWEREPLISKECKIYMWNNTSISNIPITAMILDPEEYIKNTTVPTILSDTNKNFAMLCKCADLYYNVNSKPQKEFHAQSMGDKSDFIFMTNNSMNQDHQKMLELSLNSDSIVQTTKAYYIINFNVLFSTEYFPCTSLKKKKTKNMLEGFECDGDGKISYNSLYLMARMQYGEKYWNGSFWQEEECDFKISLETSANYVEALNTTLNVNNQVDFKTGLELSGYIVPIPIESSASIGSVTLSFPHYQYISSDIKAVFLSNLEVNLTMKKKDKEEMEDDDVIKQEIDKTFAEEKELDSCEFSTFDDTHLAYNTVGYDVDGDYFILDVVKYGDWILKMEQIRLLKYAIQYSHPRKTVDITLRNIYDSPYYKFTNWNFGEITFIPSSYSLDFKNNSTSLKLIEKR